MGFLYGLLGAIMGAVLGCVTALFLFSAATGGDEFAFVLGFIIAAPVGLVIGAVLGAVASLRLLRLMREGERDKAEKRKMALAVAGSVLAVPALVMAMLGGNLEA